MMPPMGPGGPGGPGQDEGQQVPHASGPYL
jgi:hypothetical protein